MDLFAGYPVRLLHACYSRIPSIEEDPWLLLSVVISATLAFIITTNLNDLRRTPWFHTLALLVCLAACIYQDELYYRLIAPKAYGSPFPSSQIYTPLNQSVDSLRILRLLPGTKTLSCVTEIVAFQEQPRYRAISYTWGATPRTLPIHINGVKTRISENLWEALYHLRHPSEERVLWADSVSINQHDLAKKPE